MTTRTWHLDTDGRPHTVELEHGVFSGKRDLRVDGQAVIGTQSILHQIFDIGGSYPISLGEHRGLIRIRLWALGLLGYQYELIMDNKPVPYRPIRRETSGYLSLWLAFVLLGNSIGICGDLAALTTPGSSLGATPPWALAAGIFFSIAYLGLVFASRWLEKWAILGLYCLSVLVFPVNFISFLYLFHPSGMHGLEEIPLLILPALLALLSWLLGFLGIVILVCLLQGSGYLAE